MATSTISRPLIRTRPSSNITSLPTDTRTPSSPRTPLLGRSISSQFNSPSAFRPDQDDHIIYELGSRHLSAGFSGENRPRCVYLFGPEKERRIGDYRAVEPGYQRKRKFRREEDWGREYELYRSDLRAVDLGLVEDKLERVLRSVHADFLQLDQKPRKAVLALPSLLPTPLVEVALKVLFNHYAQPAAVTLLTTPLLACVGAGLRNALVVDMGWEECVVTALGEYKEVCQRRSVRAGKMLTRAMGRVLEEEVRNQTAVGDGVDSEREINFNYAEEVTQRMGWCRSRDGKEEATKMIKLPSPNAEAHSSIHISFLRLSKPAESLFTNTEGQDDDHNLPIPTTLHGVLLALPVDLRAICVSRIIFTGGLASLPGLKSRILQELEGLISKRGWDPVQSYGSATAHHERVLQERSANIAVHRHQSLANGDVPLSPAKKPLQEAIPHSARIHDDKHDPITLKAEREATKGRVEAIKGIVRGVETLGAWVGASLVVSLRVKGVHEIERDQKKDEWNL